MQTGTLTLLVALAGWCEGQATLRILRPDVLKYQAKNLGYGVGTISNVTSVPDIEAKLLKGWNRDFAMEQAKSTIRINITFPTPVKDIYLKCSLSLKTANITTTILNDNETCKVKQLAVKRFISHNYVITPLKSRTRKRRESPWTEYIGTKGTISNNPNPGSGDWVSKYVSHRNADPKPNVSVETYRFGDGQPNTNSWTSYIGGIGSDRGSVHADHHVDQPNTNSWMSYIGGIGSDRGSVHVDHHVDQSDTDRWTSYIGGNWPERGPGNVGQDTCGKVTIANPYPLLLNGKPTLTGQWPWQIALFHNKHFTCGGTLVSREHVVTAAHCVTLEHSQDLVNKDALSVYLGIHNLRIINQGVQNKNVENIIVHPQYSGSTFANDVSVVKLAGSVEVTDYVRPVCLWPEHRVDVSNVIGETGIVVGWGQNENRVTTDELGLVKMPIVSQEDCLRVNRLYDRSRWGTTYCAGFRDDTTACYGDSGGGMVLKLQNTWYLRGLVSLTINDCDPSHYIIFTDLAKFLSWIKENMR